MKRPAFQFYVESWMANAKLRRCSWAARGVWAAVLCTMHDSDEYGILRWPLSEIAQSIGCPPRLLSEVVVKGVMKGSDHEHEGYIYRPRHAGKEGAPVVLIEPGDGPCWFSSRMVRDEYVRTKAGVSTRFRSGDNSANSGDNLVPSHRQGTDQGSEPSRRQVHGAMSLDSISINVGVKGTDSARPREPHPLGDRSPLKVNGKGKPPAGWHRTDEGIEKAGRIIGLPAKRGEDYESYKARIFEALREGTEA